MDVFADRMARWASIERAMKIANRNPASRPLVELLLNNYFDFIDSMAVELERRHGGLVASEDALEADIGQSETPQCSGLLSADSGTPGTLTRCMRRATYCIQRMMKRQGSRPRRREASC